MPMIENLCECATLYRRSKKFNADELIEIQNSIDFLVNKWHSACGKTDINGSIDMTIPMPFNVSDLLNMKSNKIGKRI